MVYEIPIQHDMPNGAQMTLQLTGMGGGGGARPYISYVCWVPPAVNAYGISGYLNARAFQTSSCELLVLRG